MADISTVWDIVNGVGDYVLSGASLQSGNDLATAILISTFTDRLAADDDVIPDGSNDPRGWPGDLGQPYRIGSRMWLLERRKAPTQQTLDDAFDYLTEAYQWMIDDGVVARFDITTEWTQPGMLGVRVVAWRQDGTNVAMAFPAAWKVA